VITELLLLSAVLEGARRQNLVQYQDEIADLEERRMLRGQRTRYLERIGSTATFPMGMMPSAAKGAVALRPMLAAITENDVVLLASEVGPDVEVEYARFPRNGVEGLQVLDSTGSAVPQPLLEAADELRPDVIGTFVLEIDMKGTADDASKMGLIFRSTIGAKEAMDRLRTHLRT
jgi:hypothetical protein